MRIRRTAEGRRSEATELAAYCDFVRRLTDTCTAAAGGDLEARMRPTEGSDEVPELRALLDGVNRVLDVSDAFVRKSTAALVRSRCPEPSRSPRPTTPTAPRAGRPRPPTPRPSPRTPRR